MNGFDSDAWSPGGPGGATAACGLYRRGTEMAHRHRARRAAAVSYLDLITRRYPGEVYPTGTDDRALHAGPLTPGSGLW